MRLSKMLRYAEKAMQGTEDEVQKTYAIYCAKVQKTYAKVQKTYAKIQKTYAIYCECCCSARMANYNGARKGIPQNSRFV